MAKGKLDPDKAKDTQIKPGQVLNPKGYTKGRPNNSTIIKNILNNPALGKAILDSQAKKPKYWDLLKSTDIMNMITLAQAIEAMNGDTKAFTALMKFSDGEKINHNVEGLDEHLQAERDLLAKINSMPDPTKLKPKKTAKNTKKPRKTAKKAKKPNK